MALLPILSVPDPRLRMKAEPVDKVDRSIQKLMDDMLETMLYKNRGVGLAANQVGILKRVIVCHFGGEINQEPLMMANPEIISTSDDTFTLTEGCLSVPGQWSDVARPKTVGVRYLDYDNIPQERVVNEEMSSVLQHEIDHLNGILFVDHLSSTKKRLLLERALKPKARTKL